MIKQFISQKQVHQYMHYKKKLRIRCWSKLKTNRHSNSLQHVHEKLLHGKKKNLLTFLSWK